MGWASFGVAGLEAVVGIEFGRTCQQITGTQGQSAPLANDWVPTTHKDRQAKMAGKPIGKR